MIILSIIPFVLTSAYFYFSSRKLIKQLNVNQNNLDQLEKNIKTISSLK